MRQLGAQVPFLLGGAPFHGTIPTGSPGSIFSTGERGRGGGYGELVPDQGHVAKTMPGLSVGYATPRTAIVYESFMSA